MTNGGLLTYEDKVGTGGECEAGSCGSPRLRLEPLVKQLELAHLTPAVGPGGRHAQATVHAR